MNPPWRENIVFFASPPCQNPKLSEKQTFADKKTKNDNISYDFLKKISQKKKKHNNIQ
jgi:hypothetical protein